MTMLWMGEVMLADAMNDEAIPILNGYPVRLVVPGYYGTYWVNRGSIAWCEKHRACETVTAVRSTPPPQPLNASSHTSA